MSPPTTHPPIKGEAELVKKGSTTGTKNGINKSLETEKPQTSVGQDRGETRKEIQAL